MEAGGEAGEVLERGGGLAWSSERRARAPDHENRAWSCSPYAPVPLGPDRGGGWGGPRWWPVVGGYHAFCCCGCC